MTLPRGVIGCLQFVIVAFPDHIHLFFFIHLCMSIFGLNIFISLF